MRPRHRVDAAVGEGGGHQREVVAVDPHRALAEVQVTDITSARRASRLLPRTSDEVAIRGAGDRGSPGWERSWDEMKRRWPRAATFVRGELHSDGEAGRQRSFGDFARRPLAIDGIIAS